MASLKVYLDNRSLNKQSEAPLKISISHRGTSALLSLGLYLKPSDWDKNKAKVINHPRRNLLNSLLAKRLSDMQSYILTNSLQETIARYFSLLRAFSVVYISDY